MTKKQKKFPPTPKAVKRIAVYPFEEYLVLIGTTKDKVMFYKWDRVSKLWNECLEIRNYKSFL